MTETHLEAVTVKNGETLLHDFKQRNKALRIIFL